MLKSILKKMHLEGKPEHVRAWFEHVALFDHMAKASAEPKEVRFSVPKKASKQPILSKSLKKAGAAKTKATSGHAQAWLEYVANQKDA